MNSGVPALGSVFAALLFGVFLNLISANKKAPKKLIYHYFIFAATSVVSVVFLISSQGKLHAFFRSFEDLTFEEQFFFVLFAVSSATVIMMGSTILSTDEKMPAKLIISTTPASIDCSTTFDVPETLPEDDKQLFDFAFEK